MHFLRTLHIIAILIAAGAILSACASDDPNQDGHRKSSITVRLALATTPMANQSRSAWTDPNAADGEMMHSAYVVMANESGRVTNIIAVKPNAESEHEVIKYITTESGTYTFYNFGNIAANSTQLAGSDATELSSLNIQGLTFRVGSQAPASAAASATTTCAFNNFDLATHPDGIPMTNIESHALSNNETVELQLYRQLSKLRFLFTNQTASKVRVENVTVGNVTANGTPIYLFPPKDDNDGVCISWPNTAQRTTQTFTYYDQTDAPLELSEGQANVALPDQYINESQTDHATGRFPLNITLKRMSGTEWQTDERHALITLSDAPRNALVMVPITLTDFLFDLEAFFYPPIGGYPPYSMVKHNDEYYATFKGAGDFQLIPHIYRYADRDNPEEWFTLNNTARVESYTMQVNDPSSIFSTRPHVDQTTGEILGTLSGNTGRASVHITAYLKVNESQTQVYNRTVFFIAETND